MEAIADWMPQVPLPTAFRRLRWVQPLRFTVHPHLDIYQVEATIDFGYGHLIFRETITAFNLYQKPSGFLNTWIRKAAGRLTGRIHRTYLSLYPRSTS